MQYIITAYDGEGTLAKRMEVRDRHLEHMAGLNAKKICAGGLLDEEGKMKGSVLILDFESEADLEAYLATEPYILEKVWDKVVVDKMNVVYLDGKKIGK